VKHFVTSPADDVTSVTSSWRWNRPLMTSNASTINKSLIFYYRQTYSGGLSLCWWSGVLV